MRDLGVERLIAWCLNDARHTALIPASIARAMTPERKQQAMPYARRNDIRWRIVEGK